MKVRRSASVYYLIQGASVFIWWAALYFRPEIRTYFVLEDSETSLLAFWLADLSFLGAGSLLAAYLCHIDSRFQQISAWFATGAISYAAVYTLVFALFTDQGWLGVSLMMPAMIWSGSFAVGITFSKEMFRQAAGGSSDWIVAKTFTQIVVVWSIILGIFPYLITVVEDKLGVPRLHFAFQKPLAALLFVVISSVGVWAAYVMSRLGQGTPLPLDHAKNLVVLGPYAYVRNPMAVSGIGQGLAVALFLGSPFVAAYALMGSLIWQLIFRPLEEEDLSARFSSQYQRYQNEVKCWIPRRKAYQMEGTAASSNSEVSPVGSM